MERRTDLFHARYRRIWRRALLASLAVHVVVLLVFRGRIALPASPFAAAGRAMGDIRAATGASTDIVALRSAAAPEPESERTEAAEEEAEIAVPVPEPRMEVAHIEPVRVSPVRAAGGISGVFEREAGSGAAAGQGAGDAGTSDQGLYRVLPPTPRGLILPPSDRPGSVRGKEVAVWVFVTAHGAVVADSTRIDPSSGDRKFDDRLRRQAAEWVFEPAKRGGEAVAEWFRYLVIL